MCDPAVEAWRMTFDLFSYLSQPKTQSHLLADGRPRNEIVWILRVHVR